MTPHYVHQDVFFSAQQGLRALHPLIGARLGVRGCAAQQAEAAIGIAVVICMLTARHPNSVRHQKIAAARPWVEGLWWLASQWRWCTLNARRADVTKCIDFCRALLTPNKHNTDSRRHTPRMKFKVQNWPKYKVGLRQRGSLTLWIEEAALARWQCVGSGEQARYQDIAIESYLILRAAFKMALRQTEGLMASVLTLTNQTVSAPDHTTVSRRSVGLPIMKSAAAPNGPLHVLIDSTGLEVLGAGQWLEAKHGARSRRTRCKLHLAVDTDSGMVDARVLTDQQLDDASPVRLLLDQIDQEIEKIIADGAYDGAPTYQTIAQHGGNIKVVIALRKTAFPVTAPCAPNQRHYHLEKINTESRLAWQTATGYEQRALAETTMGRYKSLICLQMHLRGLAAQQTEAAIRGAAINRMLAAARPSSVRSQKMAA